MIIVGLTAYLGIQRTMTDYDIEPSSVVTFMFMYTDLYNTCNITQKIWSLPLQTKTLTSENY